MRQDSKRGSGERRRPAARRRWLGPAALVIGLLPAMGVALTAVAGDDAADRAQAGAADETPWQAKRRVLGSMTRDASVLINVTHREMPASPDILNLGKRGTAALGRCLADNIDAGMREMCAMFLGRIGDRRALPPLQAALDDWEPSVRNEVVRSLALIPDASSIEPLLKLYRRKDEEGYNRGAILATLGALSHPKAVSVLRAELRSEGSPTAFRALWMSRHLVARTTLVSDVAAALAGSSDGLVLAATEASAELRATRLVSPLTPLLEHRDAEIRNKAVYALGLIGDRSATKALLARLPGVRDARMLNNIAFALERLDREAFYASIQQVIEHKQAIIRLNAAFVLGDVQRPEGLSLLEKALADPSDYVKTSAVVALGKLGTDKAIPPLEKLVDAPNLNIRQEAIYALHTLTGGKRGDLIYTRLFQAKNEGVRRRAAIALGKAGDPRVRDYLLGCLEMRSCAVADVEEFLRRDGSAAVGGRLLLSWVRGRNDLTELVADLRPSGTMPLAMSNVDFSLAQGNMRSAKHAMDLVGKLGDPAARERIQGSVSEGDAWLRVHASVALARLGDAGADATLLRDLDNFPASWLPGLAAVLRRVDKPEVRARFTPELVKRESDADAHIALAAASVRLAWDPEEGIFRLLDGLGSAAAQERELSARYLRKDRSEKVTWVLRRALAREKREDVRDRLRELLVGRS